MLNQSSRPNRRRLHVAGYAAAAVLVVGGLALIVNRTGGTAAETASGSVPGTLNSVVPDPPNDVIEDYVSAYNAGDIDEVMSFFDEDSVIIGHPFAARSEGVEQIRGVMVADLSEAADTNAYTISNLEATGNTVTWDHRWTNRRGAEFCGTGHSTRIDNGKIDTWTWPSWFDCP